MDTVIAAPRLLAGLFPDEGRQFLQDGGLGATWSEALSSVPSEVLRVPAQAAALLPEEKRERFESFVQWGILLARQEDGSMWDFWIANNTKGYGTSFGIMGLEPTLAQEP